MSSHLITFSLVTIITFSSSMVAGDDLCPLPKIPNGGTINTKKDENFLLAEVVCNRGFERIGNPRIRCRKGVWSGTLPVCTALGSCHQPIEVPRNGRVIPVRGSRESAYRFACNLGFQLVGDTISHCVGQSWSHTSLPFCAKNGCDELAIVDFSKYGKAIRDLDGALYRFSCPTESPLVGPTTIYCDGQNWNSSIPYCQRAPNPPSIDLLLGGESVAVLREGDLPTFTCRAASGNPTPDVQITVGMMMHPPKNFIDSTMFKVAADITQVVVSCTATNLAGSSTGSITIPVLVAPDNMRIEGPEGVQQDTVNVFKCHVAIGNPPPEVFWIVEDEDGDRREDGDTLMLSTKVTRTVLMSCHAENSEGKLTESRRVPVHHLPAFVTISLPTIVENTILEGGLVSADCTAAPAQPKPNLVWKVEDGRGNQVLDGIRIVQDGRGVLASSELTMTAGQVGQLTLHCAAVVANLGKVEAQPVHIQVQASTTTSGRSTTATTTTVKTATSESTRGKPEETSFFPRSTYAAVDSTTESPTEKKVSSPVIFGARQGASLRPGEVTVFTCSAGAKAIKWLVGGEEMGEGSEYEVQEKKVISSWEYIAKPGDSSVECVAVYQIGNDMVEKSSSIAFVVENEQMVTLRNIEDKTKLGENAMLSINDADKSTFVRENLDKLDEEKIKLEKMEVNEPAFHDVDAVDRIAGFASAPEEQFYDAGEEELEAVDSKVESFGTRGNKVEISAKSTLASKASSIFFNISSSLLLLLLSAL